MRTLCDVCEAAAAAVFCAADEASLCASCDEKVHTCNKLASRHIRLWLAEPCAVGRCDICEKSPAFFFCLIDGTSLCLECDIIVHVGSKRMHERYLLLRQKIEFSGDEPSHLEDLVQHRKSTGHKLEHNGLLHQKRLVEYMREKMGSCRVPTISMSQLEVNHDKHDPVIFDYNSRPQRLQEQANGSSQVVHFS